MIALEEKGLQYESRQIEFSSSRSTHPPINRGTTRVVMCRWLVVLAFINCWHFTCASEVKGCLSRCLIAEGHKTPQVLALNPRGQVPVLKDGDVVISESLATLEYLDEAYPYPSLVPKGASPQVRQESPNEVKKHVLVSLVPAAA